MTDMRAPAVLRPSGAEETPVYGQRMRIRVLGPIEVLGDGVGVRLGGPKQRTILALLVAELGKVVSVDALIDGLWGDEPTPGARSTLQTYVSNLRAELGDVILREGQGYRLDVDPQLVDAVEFEETVAQASALVKTRPAEAAQHLRATLALWRGHPYADVSGSFPLELEARRLEELRLRAVEARIEAELALGHHLELVAELEVLCIEFPFREGFRAQQMLALYRSGRQAEALQAFQRTRTSLAEELGLEPSTELRELEHRILNQDAILLLEAEPQVERLCFLLTDIEDSTALWELQNEGMRSAMAQHDEIVYSAVESAGGRIVKRVGDGIDAVFSDVGAAVTAARGIQERLALVDTVDVVPLRVRTAIDIGEVEARGGDYFGPVLNRCGRLLAAAHGGQVLLSANAHADLAATESGWRAKALGEYRFKGIGTPLNVFQLLLDGLPDEFPPLRIDRLPPPLPPTAFGRSVRGYELREHVGVGRYGIVYRAYQPSVGREVAVKVIRPELVNQPSFVRQFEAEAHFVAQLEHPHIVSLYDYWRDPDGAYLIMRWLKGGSLREALERGPWNTEPAARLVSQVAGALSYAHRHGVVHGDLKPGNVLLDDEGHAYLSDFGIATRPSDLSEVERPVTSSPAYVPPEELDGQPHTARSDIYSLGLLTFELLTGRRPPMDGALPSFTSIRPELPAALDGVIAKAIATDPLQRYESVEAFLVAFATAVGMRPSVEESYTPADNPYKGLRAFGENDAEDFYGREALVGELVRAVSDHRLVAVVGPSGIGKSSAVRAGLVPALRHDAIPGSQAWLVSDMFPGPDPFEELAAALLRVAVERPAELVEDLARDELGMGRVVKRILPPETELLLVIDQFEELFTLTSDEEIRRRFLDGLTQLASDPRSRVRLVVTLRADFLDHPLRYSEFGELVKAGMVAVTAPSEDDLADAIEKPAENAGVLFEPGLVSRIIADVQDEPGALPLLQYALTELFAARTSDLLTLKGYGATGGVVGALGRRAEELYAELNRTGQAAARQVFLRLVTVDLTAQDTRRRVRRSELHHLELEPAALDEILGRYGEHRLLTFDREPLTRTPTVEVAHEALLAQWERLRDWIDERREDLLLHRRLVEAAEEWEESRRQPDYLPRASRLEQFEIWAQTTDLALTASEREFLADARSASERDAERQRRTKRRLSGLLTGVGVLLLLAAAGGIIALSQRSSVRRAATVALARQLEQDAVSEPQIDRAMLLAREGVNLDRSTQTESSMVATLLRSPAAVASFTTPKGAQPAALAVSPDGRSLAVSVGGEEGKQLFYDTATRRLRATAHKLLVGPGSAVAYTPDGSVFVASGYGGKKLGIDVRDARTLRLVRRMPYDRRWYQLGLDLVGGNAHLVVAPDAHTVFWAYSVLQRGNRLVEGPAYLDRWNLRTGRLLSSNPVGIDGAAEIAVVDHGLRVVVVGTTAAAIIDARTLRRIRLVPFPRALAGTETPAGGTAAVSPDGRTVAVGSSGGLVSFVDLVTGHVTRGLVAHTGAIERMAFSPDGHALVTTSDDTTVIVWDPVAARPGQLLTGHGGRVNGLTIAADGKAMYTSSLDGSIFEWDLGTAHRFGQPFSAEPAFPPEPDVVESPPPLAMSPDGSRFAARIGPSGIGLFSSSTLRRLTRFRVGAGGTVTAVAWSPSGVLAVAGLHGHVQLWDVIGPPRLVRTLAGLHSVNGQPEDAQAVAFSPDGRLVAAGDVNHTTTAYRLGTVAVWDVASGRPLWSGTSRDGWVHKLAFSPDGTTLAAANENATVRLFDARSGRIERTLSLAGLQRFNIATLAFSPTGTLATGTNSGIVQLWNPATGKQIGHAMLAAQPVAGIAFDPSGEEFVTTSGSDGSAKIWITKTQQQFGPAFPGAVGHWGSALYTPDGSRLVVLYDDGSGFVWPASAAAWERHACQVAGRNFTHEEWRAFMAGRSYARVCPQFPAEK